MRQDLVLGLMLGLVGVAAAHDLGSQAPVKAPMSYPENVPDPQRQGGDTIASALVVPWIPYDDFGTTVGYTNDYDAVCPYTGSTAPDVVYKVVAASEQFVTIDLCGSSYDTKLYVYDAALSLIACNDDFYSGAPCGTYVSKLENVALDAGATYYIVIDGYSAASGAYVLAIRNYEPCFLDCPADGTPEGEPPLVDGYNDQFNSGCGGSPSYSFPPLTGDGAGALTFCGVTGWYLSSSGGQFRDTDWFILTSGPAENIEIIADAEYATYLFELSPQNCSSVGVAQQVTAGPCAAATMAITGYPGGSPVWFWTGPTVFGPPAGAGNMYDYVVWFTGLAPGGIANAPTTWSTVKALYQ
jgi:hypothetical protein